MQENKVSFKETIREDLFASVVVFLIALPFSMGVALASGAPIHAGLIPGAVAAIVACALGGAPFVVSGPAASVAVIVFEIAEKYGFEAIGIATAGAGLVQLLMGTMRVAKIASRIPSAVVSGMLASVGLLMAAGQVAVLFGSTPKKEFWQNIQHIPDLVMHGNWHAASAGLITLVIIFAWPKINLFKLPASLVGILTASSVAAIMHLNLPKIDLPEHLWNMSLPNMPETGLLELIGAAVAIGFIASTESLLSAVAVDKLHTGPRARLNRELVGQGAANIVSGLLGGLPITGGSVRSTANLQARARTRAASIMHGFWLLVAATFLAELLEHVPLATLAALLITVSVRLVDPKAIKEAWEHSQISAYITTLFGVLAFGLLTGIAAGLVVSYGQRSFIHWRKGVLDPDIDAEDDVMPGDLGD
jgi:carbonic anhydrase